MHIPGAHRLTHAHTWCTWTNTHTPVACVSAYYTVYAWHVHYTHVLMPASANSGAAQLTTCRLLHVLTNSLTHYQWCGTFRERLGQSTQYCGEQGEQEGPKGATPGGEQSQQREQGEQGKQGAAPGEQGAQDEQGEQGRQGLASPAARREWSSDGYLGLPADRLHLAYTLFWVGLWPLAYWGAVLNRGELVT